MASDQHASQDYYGPWVNSTGGHNSLVNMDSLQQLNPPSQIRQQQPFLLLVAQWDDSQIYLPPKILVQSPVTELTHSVRRLRPIPSENSLADIMDLLRDVKRLAGIDNPVLRQASKEALQIFDTYGCLWSNDPGLRAQLSCTTELHVQVYWGTVFAAAALEGRKISVYTINDDGVTVHLSTNVKWFSQWVDIRSFYAKIMEGPQSWPTNLRAPLNTKNNALNSAERNVDNQHSHESQHVVGRSTDTGALQGYDLSDNLFEDLLCTEL